MVAPGGAVAETTSSGTAPGDADLRGSCLAMSCRYSAVTLAVAAAVLLLAWQVLGWAFFVGGRAEAAHAPPQVFLRGQQVYAANCAVCHGVNGDGNGMAAHMFRVRPRDFRQGIFKFRSTPFGSLPTADDLLQSVTQGVRWTGMVGRVDLPEADRLAVVQYLKTFSPRFATEPPAPAVGGPTAPPWELIRKRSAISRSRSLLPAIT
jgi:hypothetical protein